MYTWQKVKWYIKYGNLPKTVVLLLAMKGLIAIHISRENTRQNCPVGLANFLYGSLRWQGSIFASYPKQNLNKNDIFFVSSIRYLYTILSVILFSQLFRKASNFFKANQNLYSLEVGTFCQLTEAKLNVEPFNEKHYSIIIQNIDLAAKTL